jgi:hypothetical protein
MKTINCENNQGGLKMRKTIFRSFYLILITVTLSSVSFVQAQVRPYRVTDRQVQALLTRIEQGTDTYKRSMETALDRSRLDGSDTEDMLMSYITEFENATDSLKQRFDSRQSVGNDVQEVLSRAAFINAFMQRNRLNAVSQRSWTSVRTDLNTLATYYRLSWNWNTEVPSTISSTTRSTTRPYRVSDSNVQTLLTRIETNTDSFKRAIDRSLDRSRVNNTNSEDSINNFISEFENATDRLKQKFNARQSVGSDVEDVLMRANSIEGILKDYRLSNNVQRLWSDVKNDLNMLAGYYSVSWDWNRQNNPINPNYPSNSRRGFDSALTGTYRLNLRQSDNIREVIDRELRTTSTATQNDRLRTSLERRLQSPDIIAIEKRNKQIVIASSNAPQVTFSVDGAVQTEQTPNGRTINVKATTDNDSLNISYEGDRMRDFFVDFMPVDNGRQLRVTRRIYLDNRNDMITVNSVYDKTSETAQWSTIDTNNSNAIANSKSSGNLNDFVIPNGTQITANLDNILNTRDSKDGDRFTMTVRSPSQFEGAVITGRVLKSESSGRVSGRANLSLDFDSIRLRNGQTYRFAGIIDGVTGANGDNVSVNNEGAVRDSNQTTKTVTRAGIGAALGALIGAIAGGGEGAAIGAAVGAGAGAGTIFIQGRDNLELGQGSEFRITASAPGSIGSR